MAKSVHIISMTNSANMEILGLYRKTWPIQLILAMFSVLAEFKCFFFIINIKALQALHDTLPMCVFLLLRMFWHKKYQCIYQIC